jgi:cleavage and polyadenylation specificity factor subunit 1
MNLLSIIDGVDCLQAVLSTEPPRRSNTREPLKEALVADLGDRWTTSPYLIV